MTALELITATVEPTEFDIRRYLPGLGFQPLDSVSAVHCDWIPKPLVRTKAADSRHESPVLVRVLGGESDQYTQVALFGYFVVDDVSSPRSVTAIKEIKALFNKYRTRRPPAEFLAVVRKAATDLRTRFAEHLVKYKPGPELNESRVRVFLELDTDI